MTNGVRIIIRKDNKFLLCQHSQIPQYPDDIREPEMRGRWSFPGGHLKKGESEVDGIKRELYEEFGIKNTSHIGFVDYISYKGKTYAVYSVGIDEPIKRYDEREIENIGWFSLNKIKQLKKQGVLHTGYELDMVKKAMK